MLKSSTGAQQPLTRISASLVAVFAASLWSGTALAETSSAVDYGRDVRPILSEKCFHCHGQDPKQRMAGLRLDTQEGATARRGNRVALVPGDAKASGIYQRITAADPARRMPPLSSHRTLTPAQIDVLKRWIDSGGQYSKHWAFIPPRRPRVPEVHGSSGRNPIDAFVLQRLQADGLRPAAPASAATWLRRVSLDLTGLPPSPSEQTAFERSVRTHGEAAYASAVDRLLASPAYGERMAIDWLDVARYADTHGFNNDAERSMWRWRDWVIRSFNNNIPYDRFLTEQLAGDLLPKPTLEQRIATGFGRNHVINSEGGIIEEEYRVEYVSDRVRTLGMAWMGLTLECARCHDHKYDPISQKDHYSFFAFFNNIDEAGEDGRVANAVPMMPAPTADQQQQADRLRKSINALEGRVALQSRLWTWQDAAADAVARGAQRRKVPADPAFQIDCEAAHEFGNALSLVGGVSGSACSLTGQKSGLQSPKPGVGVSKRSPLTFSFWLQPSAADKDTPLLSAMDYTGSKAATSYGKGVEVRLVGSEIEFRLSDRFPAYSVRVRSEGAGIKPEQWSHIAVLYTGAAQDSHAMRVHASWIRVFADGREIATRTLSDGAMLSGRGERPVPTVFRVGWDNNPEGASYSGKLDQIAVYSALLSDEHLSTIFERDAVPFAIGRKRGGVASTRETSWLRTASLRLGNSPASASLRRLEELRSELFHLERTFPTVMVMAELPTPRPTHVLIRGAYNAPGEKVEPSVPEALLGSWPAGAPKNRLGLAQWLTKPDHPLTARVVVNRFWQQLFGFGLVRTSDNFGLQGEWPTHPELLDWLAREFVDSGWNVKALIRQIVLSSTYRQDSSASRELLARDPENKLLARGPRFRLPAEVIRDQALSLAGLLKNRIGGPSVYPYQKEDLYKGIVVAADYPGTRWTLSEGDDLYRRSLYTFWKRTVPHPTMTTFDAPDREFCVVRRSTTNTPLQALTLLNDPIYVEAARKLAERAVREGGATSDLRISYAFRLATGRAPESGELKVLTARFRQMLAEFRRDEEGARALLSVGASPVSNALPASELAAYTAVASMILNLDEVITRG